MGTRVLLVGLDGADDQLVERWSSSGALPTLARLSGTGVRGSLAALPGLGDDAAWASFSTGTTPGRHGRWYHAQLGDDGASLVPYRRDDMTDPPFWDALAGAGQRVAVVDVPKSPLGEGDGVVVADWMSHGADGPTTRCSPAAVRRGLDRRCVADAGFVCDQDLTTADETAAYERELVERARRRRDVLLGLLDSDDWDLFVAVFAETHCVGHRCWRDHDRHHPEHDRQRATSSGDVIEHVYREVDELLGELVTHAGPDAIVVVFSLLGMGPNYSGTHLLGDVLAGLEPTRRAPVIGVLGRLDRLVRMLPARARRSAPERVRAVGRSVRRRAAAQVPYRVLPVDLPTSAIRIARAERDPHATLAGSALRDRERALRDELCALEDPDTGAHLVADVVFVDDAHPGPRSGDLFDVMVVWNQTGPITGARSARLGVVRRPAPPLRSGNHRGGGWFVAVGPGVAPTVLDRPRAIVDLAPTVAAMLGVQLSFADGAAITELCPG
jgi:predicted AlkP superfamily phosphohydrolase/phosphomutase